MKILLAVDGSDYTKRMTEYLASHAWLVSGNAFTVLTTVLPVPHRAAAFVGTETVKLYYTDDARLVLDPVRDFLQSHGVQAEYVYKVGHPAQEIARYAEENGFDLVMMGSHGHGLVKNLVMGSVATKVLAQCKVPLLLVR
ncbi:universal stress protein UspA [Rhodoferax koreense]|uniref:Universal stress protein UspA n=1 Tax=Rhodoferax koreensis TaxID=1842727 RepID=A0A1P8JU29_9BURK|nr:universal stress protein [Rhodoferax koreense]APW37253.1 universal stress protein UspA [Rhodoferax koreense]